MSAATTYAEALFEAAHELDELEETLENLKDFVNALHESDELSDVYYGVHIPETQKRRVVDAVTEGMSTSARNFLKVLVDNDRVEILEDTVWRYEDLVEEHQGKVEVEVTTAVELSDEMLEHVRSRLGEILSGREVMLETHVNPNLVGGAVFRVGGQRMDASIRGQLQGLREQLLERSVV